MSYHKVRTGSVPLSPNVLLAQYIHLAAFAARRISSSIHLHFGE